MTVGMLISALTKTGSSSSPYQGMSCVVDIEEAFEHLARIGFKKEELQRKVVEHKLIKYLTSLLGFSCKICFKFNGIKKSALEHIKESCKAAGSKEDRALHLLPFCRGERFEFSMD